MFKRCRQLWDFTSKIRQNYEPVQAAKVLDFGTAIHAGLEAYYDPQSWKADLATKKAIALGTFLETSRQQKMRVLNRMGSEDLAYELEVDFEERQSLGVSMLDYYITWATANDDFEPIMTEIEFEVPLADGLLYQGRIDLVIRNSQGEYGLVDHKTTSQFGSTEWLDIDDQVSSYLWAIRKEMGIDAKFIIYNELRKAVPERPRLLKNGRLSVDKSANTTYEMFMASVRELGHSEAWYTDYLEFLRTSPKQFIRRTLVRKSPEALDIVRKNVEAEASDMINNPAIYPTPGLFNCQGCSFLQPCMLKQNGQIEDMQFLLDNTYVKRDNGNS